MHFGDSDMSIPYTWIYLIHDPYTDLYKIGKSDTPEKRLDDLKRNGTILAAPTDGYCLIEAWLCPTDLEKHFHKEFEDRRVRGEWFVLDHDDRFHLQSSLSWYRRYLNDGSRSHELYLRYFSYTKEYAKQIATLTKERDSLLRQRSYLVEQRNTLATFREPLPETEIAVEEVESTTQ